MEYLRIQEFIINEFALMQGRIFEFIKAQGTIRCTEEVVDSNANCQVILKSGKNRGFACRRTCNDQSPTCKLHSKGKKTALQKAIEELGMSKQEFEKHRTGILEKFNSLNSDNLIILKKSSKFRKYEADDMFSTEVPNIEAGRRCSTLKKYKANFGDEFCNLLEQVYRYYPKMEIEVNLRECQKFYENQVDVEFLEKFHEENKVTVGGEENKVTVGGVGSEDFCAIWMRDPNCRIPTKARQIRIIKRYEEEGEITKLRNTDDYVKKLAIVRKYLRTKLTKIFNEHVGIIKPFDREKIQDIVVVDEDKLKNMTDYLDGYIYSFAQQARDMMVLLPGLEIGMIQK